MQQEKILVTGALGQIGTELISALRIRYGSHAVIASDRRDGADLILDVSNTVMLKETIASIRPTQIYHLAAILSASGEQAPLSTWDLNMQSLLDVLEAARLLDNCKVFWPSSIAVFGDNCPNKFCPQHAPQQPVTVYGISKSAGELWCQYYFERYDLDVRSIRYPGLISYTASPGGGTTDYAVAIFHEALRNNNYNCYLQPATSLPMLYMPDAIRATLEIMEADANRLTIRTSYNLPAISFDPQGIADLIRLYLPEFTITYSPDTRQTIADSWPASMNGFQATNDWNWKYQYDLQDVVADMLWHLGDDELKERIKAIGRLKKNFLEVANG